jgi:glycosyltransferase involved in cell wall biosynthesis
LFDAVEAVALAHRKLRGSPVRVRLAVAGAFWRPTEAAQFTERLRQPDLRDEDGQPLVDYRGFVQGEGKNRLLTESDCLAFPTYYSAESFGLVLVEGMAFGLQLITTNFRQIPEILPAHYSGVVEPKAPEQIAGRLVRFLHQDYDDSLRAHFLEHFTVEKFAERIKGALLGL